MSSYRDDVNEIVYLAETSQARVHDLVSEKLRLGEAIKNLRSGFDLHEPVVFGDSVRERAIRAQYDTAAFEDSLQEVVRKATGVDDGLVIGDAVRLTLKERIEDALVLADLTRLSSIHATRESVHLSDAFVGVRRVREWVTDGLRMGDATSRVWREATEDAIVLADVGRGVVRTSSYVVEQLQLGESASEDYASGERVLEVARFADSVQGVLRAANRITDTVVLWDEVMQTGDYGQAWTASTDSWAMSRYQPFTFDHLAVIDGVVYGFNRAGVFALSGEDEQMNATLKTGKLDMSGERLAHPVGAYLEYELDGEASFDVTTTQSGTTKTYTYPLNARPVSDDLTNARAQFGLGLRGRHFAYTLNLTGKRAYINDWSVLVAQSQRRV